MSRIRLYFDEDAMQHALVVALRARRVDVFDREPDVSGGNVVQAGVPL
jgi:hypothetical protein